MFGVNRGKYAIPYKGSKSLLPVRRGPRGPERTRGVWLVRLANFTDKETEA